MKLTAIRCDIHNKKRNLELIPISIGLDFSYENEAKIQ
jgi:hypothetical protein